MLTMRSGLSEIDCCLSPMCFSQEFISCIDNLITVKEDLREVKDKIVRLNDDVQDSGRSVLLEVQ